MEAGADKVFSLDTLEVVFVLLLRLGEHLSAGELERRLRDCLAAELVEQGDELFQWVDVAWTTEFVEARESIEMYGRGSPSGVGHRPEAVYYQILICLCDDECCLIAFEERVRNEFAIEADDGLVFLPEPKGNVAAKGWLNRWLRQLGGDESGERVGEAEPISSHLMERYSFPLSSDVDDEGVGLLD